MTRQTIKSAIQSFSYRKLPDAMRFHVDTFLSHKDAANMNVVLGRDLYPEKFNSQALATTHSIPSTTISTQTAESKNSLGNNNIFQMNARFLRPLLKAVEYADYDQVDQIIALDPSLIYLMFKPVTFVFRDGSQETISPLKYAFKVYDTYMWKMFYEKIKGNSELRKIFLKQIQDQTTHIDLEPLFAAYEEYERQYQSWLHSEITNKKLDEEWFKLGAVQRRILPVHMLKEFSREGYTWSTRENFDVDVMPRPQNSRIYNYVSNGWQSLSSLLADLGWGSSFSLLRGRDMRHARCVASLPECTAFGALDLAAFRRLFEVRKNDFTMQLSLQSQNSHENQEQKNQNTSLTLNL